MQLLLPWTLNYQVEDQFLHAHLTVLITNQKTHVECRRNIKLGGEEDTEEYQFSISLALFSKKIELCLLVKKSSVYSDLNP